MFFKCFFAVSNPVRNIVILIAIMALFVSVHQSGRAQDTKEEVPAKQSASASTSAALMNNMDAINDKRKLGLGDVLSIRIVEDESPANSISVTDSGEVEAPYIGRIQAAGKTCRQLAYELKRILEQQYYYKATVILALDSVGSKTAIASRGKVYVMGQVRSEGPQEIPADEVYTVSKAILKAGGFGQYANKRKVKIMRPSKAAKGNSETIIVDLVEILDKGITSKDIPVEPEDIIVVPEKMVNFL